MATSDIWSNKYSSIRSIDSQNYKNKSTHNVDPEINIKDDGSNANITSHDAVSSLMCKLKNNNDNSNDDDSNDNNNDYNNV